MTSKAELGKAVDALMFVFGATHIHHFNPDVHGDDEVWRASYDTCHDSVCDKIRTAIDITRRAAL